MAEVKFHTGSLAGTSEIKIPSKLKFNQSKTLHPIGRELDWASLSLNISRHQIRSTFQSSHQQFEELSGVQLCIPSFCDAECGLC